VHLCGLPSDLPCHSAGSDLGSGQQQQQEQGYSQRPQQEYKAMTYANVCTASSNSRIPVVSLVVGVCTVLKCHNITTALQSRADALQS
jgi:hypothetical protein